MSDARSRERPDALELVAIARETLLERVLPGLDGDVRYQALMIANALAIAARELESGDRDTPAELAALRGLYEIDTPPDGTPGHGAGDDAGDDAALARLEARLARDLRAGVLDGGPQYAVRRWLRARIESRLAVSNPKRVARRDPADGAS